MANYNHQPFSDWLLDEANLTLPELQSLREHLHTCEQCRSLSASLKEMELQLRAAPILAPIAGFSLRWQERLQEQQARLLRLQRRQTLTVLIFCVGGAMALFVLLTLALMTLLREPQPFLLEALVQLTRIYSLVSEVGNVAGALMRAALGFIPPTMWVALSVAFGGLCAVWILALQHYTSPRRVIL